MTPWITEPIPFNIGQGGAAASASGGSRGVFGGGQVGGGYSAVMDFITIQTEGDAETFGNLSDGARRQLAGFADSTRGCFGGGYNRTNKAEIDKN